MLTSPRARPIGLATALAIAGILAVGGVLFFVAPLLALLLRESPGDILATIRRPSVASALRLSLVTTSVATAASVLFGLPTAYALARRLFPCSAAIGTVVTLPTVLPPVVAGVALLVTFGRRGWLGRYLLLAGVSIPFTSVAVVIAQVFVAAPFFINAARAAFEGLDPVYDEAARTLRASLLERALLIAIPLAWPQLMVGIALAWARALGEFGATITFAGNLAGVTQTLPIAAYVAAQADLDAAVAIAVVLLAVSGVLLAALPRLGRCTWRTR
jgi:molybdate transport system permease protein